MEEDRVRERSEPRHEVDFVAARVEDVDGDELCLDRVQSRMTLHVDVKAGDKLACSELRQRLWLVRAAHVQRLKQLEVWLAARDVRVEIGEHLVGPRRGKRDRLSHYAAGSNRWMLVDD